MLAPLATLAFLATLWLVAVMLAEMLGQSGKVAAALKGRSRLATASDIRPIAMRISLRARSQRAWRAQPRLRAAA